MLSDVAPLELGCRKLLRVSDLGKGFDNLDSGTF